VLKEENTLPFRDEHGRLSEPMGQKREEERNSTCVKRKKMKYGFSYFLSHPFSEKDKSCSYQVMFSVKHKFVYRSSNSYVRRCNCSSVLFERSFVV